MITFLPDQMLCVAATTTAASGPIFGLKIKEAHLDMSMMIHKLPLAVFSELL